MSLLLVSNGNFTILFNFFYNSGVISDYMIESCRPTSLLLLAVLDMDVSSVAAPLHA